MASLSSALSAAAVTAAEGASLSSLPTLFVARPPHSFVSFSQKSIRLSLRKFSPLLPLVAARASDWGAPQVTAEEEESAVGSVSEWEDGQAELGEEVEDGGADLVAAGDAGTGGEDEESYPEPPEEAKLFVGNLPFDIDSEGLAKLFDEAGVVEIAEVIYNRNTDQSRGFGFVTMSTVEEADIAVEKFNRYELNGRSLTVNKAAPRGSAPQRLPREFAPTFRMYVGNLPWQVDDARLEQVFSEHGKVLDARVVYDRDSGRSRGFGFVSMSSKAELDDAIAALDGQSLDGRSIRVTVAEERARRSSF